MKKKTYITSNEVTRQSVFAHIDNSKTYKVTIEELNTEKKIRSNLQNAALHKDFANTSDILNEHGITAASLFSVAREECEVTPSLVKEFWHNVLKTMGFEPKTSKLSTTEVNLIREAIAAALATRRGVDIGDFPSIESLMKQSIEYEEMK